MVAESDTTYAENRIAAAGDHLFVPTGHNVTVMRLTPTGIGDESNPVPRELLLLPNYPNPFNAATTIAYSLPGESDVKFEAFDIAGRRVGSRALGRQLKGGHSFVWDAGDLPSGIYFARVEAGGASAVRAVTLVK
jgi:hypothetical protein